MNTYPRGVKVRCENWYWNRELQFLLFRTIRCRWGVTAKIPWNTKREFIAVQQWKENGPWFFVWCTPRDFAECPYPEWTAKQLIAACPEELKP